MNTERLKLGSGLDYFTDDNGKKVCKGAKHGRPDQFPQDRNAPIKLRMERLQWVDGDYDQGGAYWGRNGVNHVYCAWVVPVREPGFTELLTGVRGLDGLEPDCLPLVQVFVRAMNRKDAKALVRETLPKATFYR